MRWNPWRKVMCCLCGHIAPRWLMARDCPGYRCPDSVREYCEERQARLAAHEAQMILLFPGLKPGGHNSLPLASARTMVAAGDTASRPPAWAFPPGELDCLPCARADDCPRAPGLA